MNRPNVTAWVAAYERAWRSAGTAALGELFTPDAVYRQGPFQPDVVGLAAIGAMWEAERDGPDEVFTMTAEVVAVEDDTAVVRLDVHYGDLVPQQWRDLWVIRFAADGRCREFEEWPIAPD